MSAAFINVLCIVGVLAVLVLARYIARRVDYGEARFDSETGKLKDDE